MESFGRKTFVKIFCHQTLHYLEVTRQVMYHLYCCYGYTALYKSAHYKANYNHFKYNNYAMSLHAGFISKHNIKDTRIYLIITDIHICIATDDEIINSAQMVN